MAHRLYPFSYFLWQRHGRRVPIHQPRDFAAFCELLAALIPLGYAYGGPLLNLPPAQPPPPGAPPLPMEIWFLDGTDLVVLMTRPPLSDLEEGGRRKVDLGHTDLEVTLLNVFRRFFRVLARSHVRLAPELQAHLPPKFADRAEIAFHLFSGPWYQELNALDGRGWKKVPRQRRLTAAYLLRVEHLWEGGPGLLAAFGMGGVETLVWTHRLRTEFPHLLERPGFTMVEMEPPAVVPERPTNLSEARFQEWRIEMVLDHAA